MSIIKDIFLYTSQFVSRDAIKKLFVLDSGTMEYSQFMQETLAVPETFRNESISDFIFGVDDNAVISRISQVTGLYLFVDYSTITSSINSVDVKSDSFRISVTIARPSPENQDQASELLWQDKALDALRIIRKKMRDDFDGQHAIFWIKFPTSIRPFVAHSLANSIGWTMEFDVHGIDMV